MPENSEPIRIALVGLTGAGKTTSLTVLNHAMKQIGWEIYWLDNQTRIRLLKSFDEMVNDGIYPPATEYEEENHYLFRVKQAPPWISRLIKLNKRSFDVEIVDVAGRKYGLEDYDERIFAEKVTKCDGILFLIDPEEKWRGQEHAHFGTVLMNAFNELELHRVKREMFVAFCVTKMDKFPSAWDQVENFTREFVFENKKVILTELDNFCSPTKKVFCQWYPCSSVGFENDIIAEGKSRHKEDKDGRATIEDSGNITPMGVGEAFEWLLKEIGKKK